MGSPLGLPMASFQLFSGDLDEAGRPDAKAVIKIKAKKSNLTASLHPEDHLFFFYLTDLILYVNTFFSFITFFSATRYKGKPFP